MTSYEIMYTKDGSEDRTTSLDAAIAKIAAAFRRQPCEVGLDDRSSSCGSEVRYAAWLAGDGDHADPRAFITLEDDVVEPAPGWEDRAVERARREGVLPPLDAEAP